MSNSGGSSNSGISGDERYEQILLEAQHLIRRQGFASVSIRELADAVGIKVSSLYYYFSTKEQILYVLMMRTMRSLLDRSYGALNELNSKDPTARLAVLTRVGVLYHVEQQTVASMALTETRSLTGDYRRQVRASFREYTDLFVDAIQEGLDANLFDVEDATMTAFIMLSALTRISLWYQPEGRLSPKEVADIHVRRFLSMANASNRANILKELGI